MRSFLEFRQTLLEADPKRDFTFRREAERVWNLFILGLKSQIKKKDLGHENNTINYRLKPKQYFLTFNVGEQTKKPEYNDVQVQFGMEHPDHVGMYVYTDNKHVIFLYALEPLYGVDPRKFSQKDQNILTLKQMLGDKNMLEKVRTTFVHEFVHSQDSRRYKDKKVITKGTLGGGTADYYNDPSEMNAFFQESISTIETWYQQIKRDVWRKKAKIKDIAFIRKILSEPKVLVDFIWKQMEELKPKFIENLTVDNKKKLQTRIYLYSKEIFSPKLKAILNKKERDNTNV